MCLRFLRDKKFPGPKARQGGTSYLINIIGKCKERTVLSEEWLFNDPLDNLRIQHAVWIYCWNIKVNAHKNLKHTTSCSDSKCHNFSCSSFTHTFLSKNSILSWSEQPVFLPVKFPLQLSTLVLLFTYPSSVTLVSLGFGQLDKINSNEDPSQK